MICVNHSKNQASKHCQITLSLLTQILEHKLQYKLLRLGQSMNMEYSEHLEPVVIDTFARIKTRNCSNAIDQEVSPNNNELNKMNNNKYLLT